MAGKMRVEKVQVQVELMSKLASLAIEARYGAILWHEESLSAGS